MGIKKSKMTPQKYRRQPEPYAAFFEIFVQCYKKLLTFCAN
jgi:hypothetical protein